MPNETCYLYIWDPVAKKWEFRSITSGEDAARQQGRSLWKAGAAGIKIDVLRTVVEEIRQ